MSAAAYVLRLVAALVPLMLGAAICSVALWPDPALQVAILFIVRVSIFTLGGLIFCGGLFVAWLVLLQPGGGARR